tara:strand:- start:3074 stop:3271 length:198 start_codon:yes stop_codon:yes gene_type:complete
MCDYQRCEQDELAAIIRLFSAKSCTHHDGVIAQRSRRFLMTDHKQTPIVYAKAMMPRRQGKTRLE